MTDNSGLWYIAVEGNQPTGPLTVEQIIESWQAGHLDEQTLCCQQGVPQWVRLVDAKPLASAMLRVKEDLTLIRFVCACGNQIVMGRKFAGRKARCKQCGAVVRVPVTVDTAEEPPVTTASRSGLGNMAGSGSPRQVGSIVRVPADEHNGHPSPGAVARGDNDESGHGGRSPHYGTSVALKQGSASPAPSASSPAWSEVLPEMTPLQQILAELGKGETSGEEVVAPRPAITAVIHRDKSDPKARSGGYKPVAQHSCHVCGSRIEKNQKRCENCLAPLTAEEIAANLAVRRKPLLPWLPRLYLSRRANKHMIAAFVLLAIGLFYALWLHPALRNKAIVQAQVDLAEKHLATVPDPQSPMKLLRLTCDVGLLYHRPAEVKVSGKLEIPQGGAAVIGAVGDGTLSLADRRLRLRVVLDGRPYTYEASLPPPLHLAARYGDARRLEVLLSDPAVDVNEVDEQGCTALHLAAGVPGDHLRRVQVLLAHKADGTIRNQKNLTPLLAARAVRNGWCAFELDPRLPHAKPAPPDDEPPQD